MQQLQHKVINRSTALIITWIILVDMLFSTSDAFRIGSEITKHRLDETVAIINNTPVIISIFLSIYTNHPFISQYIFYLIVPGQARE